MQLVDVAAEAGCDAVKFQTFEPALLATPRAAKAAYQARETGAGSQLDMLRALVLPTDALRALQRRAEQRGLIFLSTPFDPPSADLLHNLGVPAFKISSGDLTNLPLLRHVARFGKPLLISTGMATIGEVARAIDAVGEIANTSAIVLFHCVSNYPADPADANLAAMATMRSTFRVPIGWSDHTDGIDIGIASVALGAEAIEKHFTLDQSLPGPDHKASLEPAQLRALVRAIRRVESAIGDGDKRPRESEAGVAAVARRSLAYGRTLGRGERVGADDLVALRPAGGIAPGDGAIVVGRVLVRAVEAGDLVQREDFE